MKSFRGWTVFTAPQAGGLRAVLRMRIAIRAWQSLRGTMVVSSFTATEVAQQAPL